jgi:hypothetical protein
MQVGDALSIVISRPLDSSNGRNNAWPTDGSRYALYAMGPVSEGSNATVPVVLYHDLQLPGESSAKSVSAPFDSRFVVNLSEPSSGSCKRIIPSAGNAKPQSPAAAPTSEAGATIDGPTTFEFTVGREQIFP